MATAIITREKLYPRPGSNYRAAWKWLYRVTVGSSSDWGEAEEFVGDGLGWAERLARSKVGPAGTVVKTWES